MDASPRLEVGPPKQRLPQNGKNRRWRLIGVATIVLVATSTLLLGVPTEFGVGVLSHVTCQMITSVSSQTDRWVPAVLLNTPYGGWGYGQGIADWPGPGLQASGVTSRDGNSSAAFDEQNATLYSVRNSTRGGPGPDRPCSAAYVAEITYPQVEGSGAWSIYSPSPKSDANESSSVAMFGQSTNVSALVFISNGFRYANAASISTCNGGPGTVRHLHVPSVTVSIPFNVSGRDIRTTVTIVEPENFTYDFPANFGTWDVDNLSAAGGPGGGWAFSYSPCA